MRIRDLDRVSEISGSDIFAIDGTGKTSGISASDLAKSLFTSFGSDILSNLDVMALEKADNVSSEDNLILGTPSGTKRLPVIDFYSLIPDGAGPHNSLYRGKNIQDKFENDSLWSTISDGTFKDLFVGDYFDITMDNEYTPNELVRCALAGFDLYYKKGSAHLDKHHAVIVPSKSFSKRTKMRNESNVAGAFKSSILYTTVLPKYAEALEKVFKEHLLPLGTFISNNINSTAPSFCASGYVGTVTDQESAIIKLNLMTEPEVFGYLGASSSWRDSTAGISQFPLFKLNPSLIVCGSNEDGYLNESTPKNYWLYGYSGNNHWTYASHVGFCGSYSVTSELHVRPRWIIG